MEVEEHEHYDVVNARTGYVCLVALCEAIQNHLSDIEWTVNR